MKTLKKNYLLLLTLVLALSAVTFTGCSSSSSESESDVIPENTDGVIESEASTDTVPELEPPSVEGSEETKKEETTLTQTTEEEKPLAEVPAPTEAATTDAKPEEPAPLAAAPEASTPPAVSEPAPVAAPVLADASTPTVEKPSETDFSNVVSESKKKRSSRKRKTKTAMEPAQDQSQFAQGSLAPTDTNPPTQPPTDSGMNGGAGISGGDLGTGHTASAPTDPNAGMVQDPAVAAAAAAPAVAEAVPQPAVVAPPITDEGRSAGSRFGGNNQAKISDPESEEIPIYRNKWVLGAGVVLLSGLGFMLMSRTKSA